MYAGTLPQWHHAPPSNSPIDAGKGWDDTPADSLTQRHLRHAQNNNKTADWYKVMLMIRAQQRDADITVHNAINANA